jgi:DNA mismatch repair protein MutL
MGPQEEAGQGRAGGRIRRLPDALVDQIAAGEVVERPASVVKELVENAVDAEARRVRVELREGGIALVAVTDDGLGMSPDDARLALERHATSKLRSLSDLEGIQSFGFRGEALPAIASVSRLRLRTRARGAAEAFELRAEGGRIVEARQGGGPEGTRIEVADLFAAIPARRKFLKAPATEWGHVSDWLARAALARPDVHFDVARDGRPALAWPAVRDPVDRIAAVLSEREAAALVAGEAEGEGGLAVRLFASRADVHRATAAGIHLFVNGRPVRDRLLRHAVLHVYRDVLPRGRFPTALVFVTAAPGAVDVNVHPAKWEVRFADPRSVHRLVATALEAALARRAWLGSAARAGGVAWPARVAEAGPSAAPYASRGDWVLAADARAPEAEGRPEGTPRAHPAGEAGEGLAAARPFRFADLRLLGQLLGTYLLVEEKRGLLLVDQHAAHERVLYERLRASWLEGQVPQQMLLLPVTAELEPAAAAALGEGAELTARLGFEIEPFGDASVVIRAVPALLADRDPLGLVRSLADELREGAGLGAGGRGRSRMLDAADRLFATMACHAARRAGDVLDPREQRALLDALDAIPWAPTCPHGRPVAVPFALSEIERRFGRS